MFGTIDSEAGQVNLKPTGRGRGLSMDPISAEDKDFLHENFKRFGTAWDGGLTDLQKQYFIRIEKTEEAFELNLRHRSRAAVSYVVTVDRETGGMSNTGEQLPEARALNAEELDKADEVLRASKSLWLLEPDNQKVIRLNLRDGIEALAQDPRLASHFYNGREQLLPCKVESRMLDGIAVLYFVNPEWGGELFCVAIELNDERIVDVAYVDLPPPKFKLLGPKERTFFDKSLRKHGDFGVYGNLKSGFPKLVRDFDVCIDEDEKDYHLEASPKDGHGHFFSMTIDKVSGEIRNVMAGHEDSLDYDDEPADFDEEPPE